MLRTAVDQPLTIQLNATDADLPKNPLQFWLGRGAPADSRLDRITGVFAWTPTHDQLGTNVLEVLVADNASPPGFSTQQIVILVAPVNAAPTLLAEFRNETLTIQLHGADGKRYQLESSVDLIHWTAIRALDSGQMVELAPNAGDVNPPFQFFRAREL